MTHRTPTSNGVEARYHQHPSQGAHLHRHGHVPHEHGEDGHLAFIGDPDHPRDPATGKFLAKRDPTPTELAEADTIILERPDLITADALPDPVQPSVERLADFADWAAERIALQASLVELAVESFDHEARAFQATAARLQDEVMQRSRFMVLAAAAQQQGHHPLSAYCFVADRLDPVGAAS